MRSLIAIAAVSLLSSVAAADQVKVGDEAPNFTAVDKEGNQVSLADLRGKPVVLVFSRAHW